eukprot:1383853-Rhodomonas_salina.2
MQAYTQCTFNCKKPPPVQNKLERRDGSRIKACSRYRIVRTTAGDRRSFKDGGVCRAPTARPGGCSAMPSSADCTAPCDRTTDQCQCPLILLLPVTSRVWGLGSGVCGQGSRF